MTRHTHTLGSLIEAKHNSFNLVRLVAAAAVIASHSFALVAGDNLAQPLSWGPYHLGANAVNVFFVLSGLMLSRSFDREPDWRTFTAARLLRIFPGLLVAGIVTAWIVGPFFSRESLDGYFGELHTVLYPFTALFDGHAHVYFRGSPFPDELNSSLWTIKYELLAYLIFGTVAAFGLLRRRFVAACVLVLFALALVVHGEALHTVIGNLVRFGFCFMLGVVLYRFRDEIPISPLVCISIVAAALPLGLTPLGAVAWVVAGGYAAICMASIRVPGLTAFSQRWDISYGVYLYGWPIQQVLMETPIGHGSPVLLFAAATAGSCLIGWASYTLVERPAMKRRGWLAGLFRRVGRAPPSLAR